MENKAKREFGKGYCENEVITEENVKDFGEIIAISAFKKVKPYSGKALDELYAGLIHDVFDYKPMDEPYSDGYDFAMTAICFLCEHMGKRLNDMIPDRIGKPVTIKQACHRVIFLQIQSEREFIYNTTSLNKKALTKELSTELELAETKDNDYIDNAMDKMQLNEGQRDTLNCYLAGMQFVEIARFLSVNISTIWRRKQQIKRKYIQHIASR